MPALLETFEGMAAGRFVLGVLPNDISNPLGQKGADGCSLFGRYNLGFSDEISGYFQRDILIFHALY